MMMSLLLLLLLLLVLLSGKADSKTAYDALVGSLESAVASGSFNTKLAIIAQAYNVSALAVATAGRLTVSALKVRVEVRENG